MSITHVSEREQALERENARLLDTVRFQAEAVALINETIAAARAQVPIGFISPYDVNEIIWEAGHAHVGCGAALFARPCAASAIIARLPLRNL